TVLSVAFFGGIVAGRHFPRMLPSLGAVTVPKEPRRGIDARLADRARSVEPAPVLTFYPEVTAPLTSPPPATKPKPDRSKPFTIKSETQKAPPPSKNDDGSAVPAASPPSDHAPSAPTDRVELPPPTPAGAAEPRATRYTVQVGAYGQREQAEAIRARLVAAG